MISRVFDSLYSFDIEAAHKIVALVEHKQGWQSEDNARYVVLENGDVAKKRDVKKAIKPSAKAADFEHATGEKSAQRIAQERGHKIIADANSWAELHQGLAEQGLRFEKKGSGAVVFVPSKNEPIAVKASSIDRKFSMGKLRKKLGEYEEGNYPKKITTATPESVSSVNNAEWEKYQAENNYNQKNEQKKVQKTKQEGEQKSENKNAQKKRHKTERQQLNALLKNEGFSVLNIGRHLLSQKHKQELAALRQINKQRKRLKSKPLRPRFETWLRLRGLHKHADKHIFINIR